MFQRSYIYLFLILTILANSIKCYLLKVWIDVYMDSDTGLGNVMTNYQHNIKYEKYENDKMIENADELMEGYDQKRKTCINNDKFCYMFVERAEEFRKAPKEIGLNIWMNGLNKVAMILPYENFVHGSIGSYITTKYYTEFDI